LGETPGNYFIANNQIQSIKIKERFDSDDGRRDVRLVITASNGKTELHYTTVSKRELKKALQQTLGNRVR
jgi:hypothetical protein